MTKKLPEACRLFLEKYQYTTEQFEATKMTWETLEAIRADYESCLPELQQTANSIPGLLHQVPVVHSTKLRLKSPEHVIEKIIRKLVKEPGEEVTVANYAEVITDRIGVRALHLFKGDWLPIHEFVTEKLAVAGLPIAYVRGGDDASVREMYEKAGCEVTEHPFGYRSIHFLLQVALGKQVHVAELQVRTLFEEAWSEVDHRLRYRREGVSPYLSDFLDIFNRVAGTADEMATFIQALSQYLQNQEAEREKHETEMEKLISASKASDAEKASLRKQLEGLRHSTPAPFSSLGTIRAADTMAAITQSDYLSTFKGIGSILTGVSVPRKCKRCGTPLLDGPGVYIASDLCTICQMSPGGGFTLSGG